MKAEKNSSSAQTDKPKTRYDRKMEARRLQAEREKRNARIAKVTCIVIAVLLVAAAVSLTVSGITKKHSAMNDTYVMVGEEEITKHEYDFYYNMYLNQFLSMYSSILSYMGIDTTQSYASQQYDETRTWKDVFDESAMNEMINVKALYHDAQANGFEYDTTEEYEELLESAKESAESSGVSLSRYYKLMYGTYATVNNIKPYIEENIIAEAYYDSVLENSRPSEDEIQAYYEENKKYFDLADFYSFTISAQAAEGADMTEENEKAMEQAYEMADRVKNGEDFETLCLEYCTEDERSYYESTDSEYSLSTGQTYSAVSSMYNDWLYDEERVAGDVEVFEDTDNMTYYIVKFAGISYDESCVDTISDTLAATAADEYVTELVSGYVVTDVKGELSYLEIEED